MSTLALKREYKLVMPSNYIDIDRNEMEYVDGGATTTQTGTAKYLKTLAGGLMASWTSLAGGYGYGAAVSVATVAGLPVSAIAGVGAAYCLFAANLYREAYNYFSLKSQTSNTLYKLTTITFLGVVTGVDYGIATTR